ncbi:MAG: UvrD-helicase domain-containing protein [Betaproteobacteria bacterium]
MPTKPVKATTMSERRDNVADEAARIRALDVQQSFIVRAPAGSGKTRLLIQRYLVLLARVDEPEEITAITFTRKAAAEMRARVLRAFLTAHDTRGDADPVTRDLARAALARDAGRDWQLVANPSRLRIQTIDALNASLTRQMPLTARFGAQPESVDDARVLYHEAARNLLAQVNDGDAVADDVATLLAHLDNNLGVAENLLADMLRSRDHWLRNLGHMHEREILERSLARIVARAISHIAAIFPEHEKHETLALMRFSGQNMAAERAGAGVLSQESPSIFPSEDGDALPAWLQVAQLFLTQDGGWRKRRGLNKNAGFPTSSNAKEKVQLDAWKNRMGELLERLAVGGSEGERLNAALVYLRSLPPSRYSDEQWEVLGAIVRLLPHVTAQLWNVFSARGQCDFTEISQAASRALGSEDAPTDLALALDYRIRHLLIDEFQDTSFAQFALLEKLTRGWSEGDGRTLLAVGDPMQSIYRFREAEVALFLRAAHSGIGAVPLQSLNLQVNFRSQPGVVEWVNETFGAVMPHEDEAAADDVPYSASVAYASGETQSPHSGAVRWHPQFLRTQPAGDKHDTASPTVAPGVEEARRVVHIIASRQREKPDAEIAILVRNRAHLKDIVPALKSAGIVFRAVEIDPLKERPVVTDLLELTRALLHPADRIAWLAILRAPWCGLTLNDLAALVQSVTPVSGELLPDARTIPEILGDSARLDTLSADGQVRVTQLRECLSRALRQRRRQPLRDLVESTWWALKGPACLAHDADLDDARLLLNLLEDEAKLQAGGNDITDLAALDSRVQKLFAGNRAPAGNSDAVEQIPPVQIMTIHKAKGLEFDTVIVPGLHRTPRRDDRKLLVWTEQASEDDHGTELLLAPIRETGAAEETDAIYRFVQQRDWQKQQQENIRLLYVAATRAEQRLHLLATVTVKDKTNVKDGAEPAMQAPRAGSLLASLWPAVAPVFEEAMIEEIAGGADVAEPMSHAGSHHTTRETRQAMRLVAGQQLPVMAADVPTRTRSSELPAAPLAEIDFEWAGDLARHVGTVAHLFLQQMADEGLDTWSAQRITSSDSRIEQELTRLGVGDSDVAGAAKRVTDALAFALSDPRGRWILQSRTTARSEWRVTGIAEGHVVNIAIDRTFVDDEGVPWIIDFKTGGHEGANVEAFLDNEQKRYRRQLEAYAEMLQAMRPQSPWPVIKLGLYFPLLKSWREWTWEQR